MMLYGFYSDIDLLGTFFQCFERSENHHLHRQICHTAVKFLQQVFSTVAMAELPLT
jgi:hypothetical protein